MRKYRSSEMFKKEVFDLYGDQLVVIGEFTNMKTKIEMYCTIHNESFNKEPDKIINRNQHCKKCGTQRIAKSRKIKHDEFLNKFHLHRDSREFTVLSEYRGDKEAITLHHSVCNEEYATTPLSIWNSKGCPICNDKRKNISVFKAEVFELVKNEYEVLGEYTNCYTYINMKHGKCGHEWEVIPNSFLQGSRCPKCFDKERRKSQCDFEKEISDIYKGEYSIIGMYRNSHTKISILHNVCGNMWEVTPSHLLSGNGCPNCNKFISKGEMKINNLLLRDNIDFKNEHLIRINKKKLRLDFLINNRIAIEYDGIQHFKKVDYFGGMVSFEHSKLNDKIKNQYCIDNEITLIRIPYKQQKNIEYILNNVLIHFGLIEYKQDTYDKDIVLKYLVDENWDHEKYIEENK